VALDLPAAARAELASWRDDLVRERDDLRPVAEQALHVTLAFLGYRPEKEAAAIAETMSAAVGSCAAPALAPGAVKPIPPRRPRLFALDLDDPDGACARLQQAVSDALEAKRFYKPEKRPFWPHVTLARVKRDRRAEPLPPDPPPLAAFRAETVTLYRSTLRPQGAVYESLARVSV
jgi:RNA 2',3'-cyclic 3'-phosphodiesterase